MSKEGRKQTNIHCFIAPSGNFVKTCIYFFVGRDI